MKPGLILVMASLFTWGAGEGMFIYFQPIYLEQLGASPMLIGSIFSAFGLMMMVTHIPAGYLADRFGRKPLIITAWICGMSAAWVMALSKTLPIFVVGYLLYGLTAFVSSPLFSYVTAARGKLSAGRAMTLASAMFNLGAVIGPVTGGWIGDHFSLRTIYLFSACLFMVSALIIVFVRRQPRDDPEGETSPKTLLSNPRYRAFMGVAFLATFVMFLPQPLTPNFLQNERGISLTVMGVIGSVASFGNAVLNIVLGQLAARIGFLLAQVCVAAFAILLWHGNGPVMYGLGYFLLGGFRAARMLAFAQVRPLIHPAQMGLAYGITETVSSLAVILAPLLAGIIYEQNPVWIYPLTLGLIALSVLFTVLFAPRELAESCQKADMPLSG
ncbi:MAG: MFS transporter [Chloroflexota bacterium]